MSNITQRTARKEWSCTSCSNEIKKGEQFYLWHEHGKPLRNCMSCGSPGGEKPDQTTTKKERKKLLKRKTRPRVNKRIAMMWHLDIRGTIIQKDQYGYAQVQWDEGRTTWSNPNYLITEEEAIQKIVAAAVVDNETKIRNKVRRK